VVYYYYYSFGRAEIKVKIVGEMAIGPDSDCGCKMNSVQFSSVLYQHFIYAQYYNNICEGCADVGYSSCL